MRLGRWVRRQSKIKLALAALVGLAAVGHAAVAIEALARARLGSPESGAPTRLYARPIVLAPGQDVDRRAVERHLQRLGYQRARRSRVGPGQYYLGSSEWVIGRRPFRLYDRVDPGGVAVVRLGYRGQVWSVRDAQGRRLEQVALEPEVLATLGAQSTREDRMPVPLSAFPAHLIDAVLSIEDQRFYQHHGLDFTRILGAARANLRAGRVVQGASTITQQLAKNLFLSPRRSPIRKAREAAMALVLEDRHTKDQILAAYLNEVYLGQDGAYAIHGMGRAAQFFFGRDISQLTLGQAALLAGLIRGPNLYSPFRHPARALERRDLVLRLMHQHGIITDEEYEETRDAPLRLRPKSERTRRGRYFVDHVVARLAEAYPGRAITQSGLSVFTTLDLDLQGMAEEAVHDGLARLERQDPDLLGAGTPVQAALVAIDPRTGEVLAMVGGRDYGQSQFNRAVHAYRQPGSAFKPIVALAALSREGGHTLASTLEDQPLRLETPTGVWQPVNYDRRFRGTVTLRDALERSLNVPFARLGLDIGPERIVETGRNLGLTSRLNPVPSIALGAFEVTPLELARAFGVLAATGFRAEPHAMLGVVDVKGNVIEQARLEGEWAYDPAETYLVTSALIGAVDQGTGRGLRHHGFRGPVAAKSGTTNGFRDAWFVGYTPELAVGVWVGFDDATSLGLSGSRAALPIFAQFMRNAVGADGSGDFPMPSGVEVTEIDQETGLLGGPGCRGEPEVFLRGTAPEESCSPYWNPRRSRDRWSTLERNLASLFAELERRASRSRN
jgi:penicillin-binding protein 1B